MQTRLNRTARVLVKSVIAAAVLSGCSSGALRSFFGSQDEEGEVDVASPPPPSATAAQPPLSARLALPPASPMRPSDERAARRPARPTAPDAPADARPVVPAPVISVAGLTESEVLSVMGEPHQRNERGGRKIWIYAGAGCRVEVTFFRDVTKDAYAALSQKVVGSDGASRKTCERSVRSAARQ